MKRPSTTPTAVRTTADETITQPSVADATERLHVERSIEVRLGQSRDASRARAAELLELCLLRVAFAERQKQMRQEIH